MKGHHYQLPLQNIPIENEQLATPRQAAAVTQAQVSVEWTSTSLEEEREKNVMVNEFYEIKII